MSNKILVTGATGTIGKALIKNLQSKNVNFVAGVRNVSQAKEKLKHVSDFVEFDFANPSTFEKATVGVDRVFILGPGLVLNLDELLKPFIDFLNAKQIKRVVYISAFGMENIKEMPFHTITAKKLQDDGFDYTILKPSFFSENFKTYEFENITQRGIVYVPAADGKVGFVDVKDIAETAATVLTTEGHSGKVYELTGPELFSYDEAAKLLSQITGKTIVYPRPSNEEFTATLKAAGAPDFVAPYMINVYSLIANNHVNKLTHDVEKVTGRKPGSLKEALTNSFA